MPGCCFISTSVIIAPLQSCVSFCCNASCVLLVYLQGPSFFCYSLLPSASPSTLPHLVSALTSCLVVGCSFPEFLPFLTFGDDDTCSEIPQYSAILLSVSIFSYLYNWN